MNTVHLGDLDVVLSGGTDRKGGGDGPLVVLLHGYGAPGDDLVALARALDVPSEVRFAFPAAPIDLGSMLGPGYGSSRAWWHIDIMAYQTAIMAGQLGELSKRVPDGLEEAGKKLLHCLGELEATLAVPKGKLVLGGFSQGAMLSMHTALHRTEPVAGLVLMSGALVAGSIWLPKMERMKGIPVFHSHGENDSVVPFQLGDLLHRALLEAGAQHDWVPFRGGHEIPAKVLSKLGTFVNKVMEKDPNG